MSPSHHGRLALALSAAALFVAIGGSAIAAIAAIPQDGRFTACYQTSNSVLDRIVLFAEPNESCPSTYARVTWSQAGQAGPAGPQGPQGPPGPQGPAGSSSQGSTGRFTTLVAQKRAHVRHGEELTVKCPTAALGKATNLGAVGGGASGPGRSYPSIDAKTGRATGWTFELYNPTQLKFTTGLVTEDRTSKDSFPEHSHGIKLFSIPRISGYIKGDMDVTVFAICARAVR